jgi:hypothetical protein
LAPEQQLQRWKLHHGSQVHWQGHMQAQAVYPASTRSRFFLMDHHQVPAQTARRHHLF